MQSVEGKLQRKRKTKTSIQKSEGAATRMVIHIQKKWNPKARISNRINKEEKSWVESVEKKTSKKSIEKEKKQLLPVTFS
jgi:hypothetical protein